MKKDIKIIAIVVFMIVVIAMLIVNISFIFALNFTHYSMDELCYQESFNIENQKGTDTEDCLLNYSGNVYYIPNGYFYINYSKPFGSTLNSLWKIKHGNSSNSIENNLSIPYNCWNAFKDKLSFYVSSYAGNGFGNSKFSCWNGTDFEILSIFYRSQVFAQGSLSENPEIKFLDGDWSTKVICNYPANCIDFPDDLEDNGIIFEEAMIWNISYSYNVYTTDNSIIIANNTYNGTDDRINPQIFIVDFSQPIYIAILFILFVIVLILLYFKQYIFASGLVLVLGFIFLYSEVSLLISFLIIVIGVLLAVTFATKK